MTLLLDSAFKATGILMGAWVSVLLLRRAPADLRHRIWVAALVAVAILPALLWLAPIALPESARIVLSAQSVSATVSHSVRAFPWLFAIWASGALLVLARVIVGFINILRLTRAASLRDGVQYSAAAMTPLTWGVFRPVILLPFYATGWSAEEREIVIRHEMAHIERRDWLWQMLAQLVTAAFWFHPLVWLASAEMRREAERAADDRVLSSGAAASDYAEQLLHVARHLTQVAPSGAVAMVRRPALESRVREILDSTRRRSRTGLGARIAIVAAAAALLVPLTAMQERQVHKIGEKGLTPPRVVSKIEPGYTQEARDAKIQGTVVLKLEIDEAGKAENIRVTRSLDEGLDAKAIEAVSQWQFEPGRLHGEPVRVEATIEVNFRLI